VDVRVLAATNRDLGQLMQQGKFRDDLFYRLNVIPVILPPLRERREDIPALAEHFLRQSGQKQGRPLRLSAEAVDKLLRYPWPGNVRELENAMARTAILAQHDSIVADDLPPHIVAGTPLGTAPSLPQALTLAEVERLHILQILERFGWNHSRASEVLGIGRTSLWRKLKEYQIEER
jgi:DNA-binding NtrC family response regulator